MITKGIIIMKDSDIVSTLFYDVIGEVDNGYEFIWCVLYSDVVPKKDFIEPVVKIQNKTAQSRNGVLISWEDLLNFAFGIHYVIDLAILGCKNKKFLHRYEDDQEMYETCDIVITMIDSSYWEVFSKDERLINRLAEKFKNTEFLNSDFER